MSAEVIYTFRRVPTLSTAVESGVDVVIAGDAYVSWPEAVRRRNKFTARIDRGTGALEGDKIQHNATRFVLMLQRGWRANVLVTQTCGTTSTSGTIEETITAYQHTIRKDPRKLIARYFRAGSAIGRARRLPVPLHVLMAIEANNSIFLPAIFGPYLVWP